MSQHLSGRPEARWGLVAGIIGALASAALSVAEIHASASSTAALGYVWLPLFAAAGAAACGVWGLALGHAVLRLRGRVQGPGLVLVAALAAALALPAALGYELWRGLGLQSAVRAVPAMDVAQLSQAFTESPWKRDRYYLGALAQHPQASGALLEGIASLRAPELWERMGSVWDVMGGNRKGLAVMRLVARHPNVWPATLEKLAERRDAEYVLHDVLANPKTPRAVLARYADSTHYLVEWGLALNPKTPQHILMRLAGSSDATTRKHAANNPATPREALEQLKAEPR